MPGAGIVVAKDVSVNVRNPVSAFLLFLPPLLDPMPSRNCSPRRYGELLMLEIEIKSLSLVI